MRTPTDLSNAVYHDEDAARAHLESLRWPNGAFCPFCGVTDQVKALGGESMGPGWYHCGACRQKFTVRVGSVFERSHIPLHKWLLGFRLMAGSKKGVSAHQLHRSLGITYKSAWFMAHRIREAMRDTDPTPMGGGGGVVEVDETFSGPTIIEKTSDGKVRKKRGAHAKRDKIVSLVERGGRSRTIVVENLNRQEIHAILHAHLAKDTRLHTDESNLYTAIGQRFASHETVNHSNTRAATSPPTALKASSPSSSAG
jgi:transposase-like protein